MKKINLKKIFFDQIWFIIIFIIVFSTFFFNHFIYDISPSPAPISTVLNDLQKESLNIIKKITELLITLATIIFGAIGIFVFQSYKSNKQLPKGQKIIAVIAFSLAALSIDFGYIYLEKWVELLANGIFVPFDPFITIPQTLQFCTFIISLLFWAIFILTVIQRKEKK